MLQGFRKKKKMKHFVCSKENQRDPLGIAGIA